MKKSKIFTPAMDKMVRELYPNIGGSKTAKAINDQHGTDLKSGAIWDRARSLGLKSNRSKMDQMEFTPAFDLHIDGFVGPCPHKAGPYLIIGKSTPHRFSHGKKTYKYPARCLSCGQDYVMLLPSLIKAKNEGRYGCNACAQKARAELLRSRKWKEDQKSAQARNEWINIMQLMPVASSQ